MAEEEAASAAHRAFEQALSRGVLRESVGAWWRLRALDADGISDDETEAGRRVVRDWGRELRAGAGAAR
jgi:hypothetical protein